MDIRYSSNSHKEEEVFLGLETLNQVTGLRENVAQYQSSGTTQFNDSQQAPQTDNVG